MLKQLLALREADSLGAWAVTTAKSLVIFGGRALHLAYHIVLEHRI